MKAIDLGTYPAVYDDESIKRVAAKVEQDVRRACGIPDDMLVVVTDASVTVSVPSGHGGPFWMGLDKLIDR